MSWHFSRALVAEYSVACSSGGEPSAPSKSTHTPEAFYWPDKTTGHSRLSRFGMTSEPLTADRGEALLTWFRAGFRAKTSASPARAMGSTDHDPDSGWKWPASSAKYSRSTRLWRTRQRLLDAGLEEFSATWPRWGSMRDGELLVRPTPELRTCESVSGLWPTPCATDTSDRKPPARVHITKTGLPKHVAASGVRSQMRLSQAVRLWPTPCARDFRHPGRSCMERTGGTQGECLPQIVGGPLNPTWVEWLMGWPLAWTDLKPLATDKFREWLRQHGAPYASNFLIQRAILTRRKSDL